jgi:hypothetical protein
VLEGSQPPDTQQRSVGNTASRITIATTAAGRIVPPLRMSMRSFRNLQRASSPCQPLAHRNLEPAPAGLEVALCDRPSDFRPMAGHYCCSDCSAFVGPALRLWPVQRFNLPAHPRFLARLGCNLKYQRGMRG